MEMNHNQYLERLNALQQLVNLAFEAAREEHSAVFDKEMSEFEKEMIKKELSQL